MVVNKVAFDCNVSTISNFRIPHVLITKETGLVELNVCLFWVVRSRATVILAAREG